MDKKYITNEIAVDLPNFPLGPIANGGFRTGYWNVSVDGRKGRIYLSISAFSEYSEQKAALLEKVAACAQNNEDAIEWEK